jgi:hypothetical protein
MSDARIRIETIDECLNLLECAFDAFQRANEAQGLLYAIEILETFKSKTEPKEPSW